MKLPLTRIYSLNIKFLTRIRLFLSDKLCRTQTPNFSKCRQIVNWNTFNLSANSLTVWRVFPLTKALETLSSISVDRPGLGSSWKLGSLKRNLTSTALSSKTSHIFFFSFSSFLLYNHFNTHYVTNALPWLLHLNYTKNCTDTWSETVISESLKLLNELQVIWNFLIYYDVTCISNYTWLNPI